MNSITPYIAIKNLTTTSSSSTNSQHHIKTVQAPLITYFSSRRHISSWFIPLCFSSFLLLKSDTSTKKEKPFPNALSFTLHTYVRTYGNVWKRF